MDVCCELFCSWFLVFTNNDNILPGFRPPLAFLTRIRAERLWGGVPLATDATLLPGACSGIELQVRAPLSRIVKGRMRREGPRKLLTSSSPSLRVGGINKDPTGSISFWGCVCLVRASPLSSTCMGACV